MCEKEFSKEELEPLEDWIEGLKNDGEDSSKTNTMKELPEFYPVYVMMTQTSSEEGSNEIKHEVVGGVVLECYPRQKIFLMAYVVVSSKCRGQGVGRTLVQACKQWATNSFSTVFKIEEEDSSHKNNWNPVLLIEVFQTKNLLLKAKKEEEEEEEEEEQEEVKKSPEFIATANRQKVWSKLGFLPLKNVELVHPGKLRGGTYNIAVMSCNQLLREDVTTSSIIAKNQLQSWLLLFFRLILEESAEEEDDEEEEESNEEEEDFAQEAKDHFEKDIKLPLTDVLEAGSENWC